jgi:pyridoxamine 5'-phosphate oxidase
MSEMRDLLRGLPVWPPELPEFDTEAVPAGPGPLFLEWLAGAIDAGVYGPHAATLATAGGDGRADGRVLICKDVDPAAGVWRFATGAGSAKGRQLAERDGAALVFYWPALARQVRVRGRAVPAGAERSAADFRARSPQARAESLSGRQSEVLKDPADLDAALREAEAVLAAEPERVPPGWTLFDLTADEVEFWQGAHSRRHVRLRYRRAAGEGGEGWSRELLWP